MSKSATVQHLSGALAITGESTTEGLISLASTFKSALYLATDQGADRVCSGGFEEVSGIFKGAAAFAPFDAGRHESPGPLYPLMAVGEYNTFAKALGSLERPTLLLCKSGRRAGVVACAYTAVVNSQSLSQAIAEAESQDLTFLKSESFKNWISVVVNSKSNKAPIIFRQLFEKESSTYSFLLADSVTKEAILIDPVLECAERDAKIVNELGLTLKYALNTHVHADHITGSGRLKELIPSLKSVISGVSEAAADVQFLEGDKIEFGSRSLLCVSTPGHTAGCTSFVLDDLSAVFTGDALLIRGCGRTDFQGGSAESLYNSVHSKIFQLPDECVVYPAHDYKGMTSSTVGEEKRLNPRLTKTQPEFIEIMAGLGLAYPKKLDISLPANMACGVQGSVPEDFKKFFTGN